MSCKLEVRPNSLVRFRLSIFGKNTWEVMLSALYGSTRHTLLDCLLISDAKSDHGARAVATGSLHCHLAPPSGSDHLLRKVMPSLCAHDTFSCHPFHQLVLIPSFDSCLFDHWALWAWLFWTRSKWFWCLDSNQVPVLTQKIPQSSSRLKGGH